MRLQQARHVLPVIQEVQVAVQLVEIVLQEAVQLNLLNQVTQEHTDLEMQVEILRHVMRVVEMQAVAAVVPVVLASPVQDQVMIM